MKRKEYQKPSLKVINSQLQCIICLSDPRATRQSYGTANSAVDEEELDEDGVWSWD